MKGEKSCFSISSICFSTEMNMRGSSEAIHEVNDDNSACFMKRLVNLQGDLSFDSNSESLYQIHDLGLQNKRYASMLYGQAFCSSHTNVYINPPSLCCGITQPGLQASRLWIDLPTSNQSDMSCVQFSFIDSTLPSTC